MPENFFVEIDSYQQSKYSNPVNGDICLTKKTGTSSYVSILCDGLGSGVEANVLASFTASMGLEYISSELSPIRSAELLMNALPVCPVRKISFSTFTIFHLSESRIADIIEHGNPQFLIFRGSERLYHPPERIDKGRWARRELLHTRFRLRPGDRLILLSDGITGSGMGSPEWPMGFGMDRTADFISGIIGRDPEASSTSLARSICEKAISNDALKAGDDISSIVTYIRNPRVLRVLTGPPVDPARDTEYSALVGKWEGPCAVCGGTTGNIIERELGLCAEVDLSSIDPVIPATSTMPGITLMTEGCITLSFCRELLAGRSSSLTKRNGAEMLKELLLSNDIIEFYVGTRVNQAHQDPDLPIELDIRRNLIRSICSILENDYLKGTSTKYF